MFRRLFTATCIAACCTSTAWAQTTEPQSKPPVPLAGSYDNGYLVAQSADGAFKYWLDGRINLDFATYQGQKNRLPTGFEVRRARLGVKATVFTNFLAEIDIDFADNQVEMKDVWMGYAGLRHTLIRVGNHKAPFGFDTLTSSKNIMFIERAYTDSWAPDRLMGVSISHWERAWQASAGVFGQAAGDFNDKDTLTGGGAGSNQGYSLVGRFSAVPINRANGVLHLGVAASRRTPDVNKIPTSGADLVDRLAASRVMKFDSRAETHVSRAKFLSTGDMKYVDHAGQWAGELAGTVGPLSFQSEYQTTMVVRRKTSVANYADHTFQGYYGQVMVFLTPNDRRPYIVSEGEFGRVVPQSRKGAVEVGLRYSRLELDDNTATDPILGGNATNVMAGVTYFMNTNHKLLLNVGWVRNNDHAKPNKEYAPLPLGTSTTQSAVVGDRFRIFAIRYQLAF